jgi:hypothetical protein
VAHRDLEGVRHLHPGRQVVGAGHRHGVRDRQPEGSEPETERVDHVFEDVAARVVPVEPPVDVTLGIERDMLRFALERRPVDVVGVAVGWDLAEPAPVARRYPRSSNVRGMPPHADKLAPLFGPTGRDRITPRA